ncbi:MAG: hypothetical protein IPL40_00215 [Proteobacteria bacterium]|nr:hypothetical protein [Pseudomonadota bacterium]
MHVDQIATLSLWLNNLPPSKTVRVYLSPIRALAMVAGKITDPSITVNGEPLTFLTEIGSSTYLELESASACPVYGLKGDLIYNVPRKGTLPTLRSGRNELTLSSSTQSQRSVRARVFVFLQGDPL